MNVNEKISLCSWCNKVRLESDIKSCKEELHLGNLTSQPKMCSAWLDAKYAFHNFKPRAIEKQEAAL